MIRRRILQICIVTMLTCMAAGAAKAAQTRILFYDPDGSYGDVVEVAAAFSHFLGTMGAGWEFQAVTERTDFETLAAQPESKFAIVSSRYLKEKPKVKLTPLLVPTSRGDAYFRKMLLARNGTDAKALVGKSIAVTGAFTGTSVQSKPIVTELDKQGITAAILVGVPKDVDALMAIYFKQVDAALVAPGSVDVLRRINPQAVQSFHVIFETRNILRSPLCAIGAAAPAETADLRTAFAAMAKNPNGRQVMLRMAFDQWAPFTAEMATP